MDPTAGNIQVRSLFIESMVNLVKKEMVVQALSLGAKHYLVKPQKPETIILKVKEILNAGI